MKLSPAAHRTVRGIVDYAGLACFFVVYLIRRDMLDATWGLLAGSVVGLVVGFAVERRVAPMPLIAGLAALVFGTLTLVFHDDRFIKIKPTIINLCFAAALLGGLALRKLPLKMLLGEALPLPDDAWRTLSLRYGLYFLFVAVLNEAVWRTQSNDIWVFFRFPGLQVLAVLFSLTQVPLMMKHAKTNEPPPPPVD